MSADGLQALKLGRVAETAGDLATARTCYQAGLDITELLAAADPANTQRQRYLASDTLPIKR